MDNVIGWSSQIALTRHPASQNKKNNKQQYKNHQQLNMSATSYHSKIVDMGKFYCIKNEIF